MIEPNWIFFAVAAAAALAVFGLGYWIGHGSGYRTRNREDLKIQIGGLWQSQFNDMMAKVQATRRQQ